MSDVKTERPRLSIIIPTLNEERSIGKSLEALAQITANIEVIVADGGSEDSTLTIARQKYAQILTCDRGRGNQMHCGAMTARGEILLFLHADTIVPSCAAERIYDAFAKDESAVVGNFEVDFDGETRAARSLTWLYPRLRKLGLCYGDSAIFVRTAVYREVGGFSPLPIFEDLDLIRRLRKRGRMVHLPLAVITSSRRFEGQSFGLALAWWSILQGLYWLGISPRILSHFYAPVRTPRIRT